MLGITEMEAIAQPKRDLTESEQTQFELQYTRNAQEPKQPLSSSASSSAVLEWTAST